ncbi:efflux transporter outer membrane subunit [Stagnimonas aquatica]|uniref:Efflux transporter outer membrane subunit n=1 Tax=Stagnimonas aquatica TaxID=2689987 RepID=A0A3N0V1R6_9GAMM|nr:efflux transporter outer membrane subunit [Stagnimonas aquatica]ROH86746.1 efflux transporter outer membrane subunit [Stagnimonas aquatica]
MRPVSPHFPPASLLLLAMSLSGCVLGPDYKSPEAPASGRYGVDALPAQTVATPVIGGEAQRFLAGKDLPDRWWTLFGSDKLNALVDEALANSPSAASAKAALVQAQALATARGADLYPSVGIGVGGTRQKVDTSSFGNPGGGGSIYNLFNASVDVSYGVDLFGGTRRGIEAVLAQSELARFQSEAAYQTLIANVVTTAIQEAQLRAQVAAQEAIVADQEKSLKVSDSQFELGAIGKSELLSAQSQLASQRAALAPLRLQLSQTRNQLAVYLGKLPGDYTPSNFELSELKLPEDLPVSLPSTLVQRRPDVLAADAALRSASANVGIAAANRLPKLALSASYGSQASKTENLFKGDVWSLGANLSAPLFDFGALKALYGASRAAYQQSEADYKLTVLNAFRNVADALRQIETDAERLQAQHESASAAAEGLKLAQLQYQLGAGSYLQLLNAQQQHAQAQAAYVQALAARYQDTAALFQALGGGWTARETNTQTAAGAP